MRIKGVTDEDFVNYRLPSMFIITSFCTFKCESESGVNCCQNGSLSSLSSSPVPDDALISRYLSNNITKAIVFGGLEPFDQYGELYAFIARLRVEHACLDDVVIYTGYDRSEIDGEICMLSAFPNIIVKFGRYVPNQESHFDETLGVMLASPNQYAERIS